MKLRLQVTKGREIRFISHLDYKRALERAIRRAKLPAAYSEGFNPHLKFSLASALGVGIVSRAEFAELELAQELSAAEAQERLTAQLPRGVVILASEVVDSKTPALMAQAAGAVYRVTVPYNAPWQDAITRYNDAPSVNYSKTAPKAVRKVKEVDVKFFIPTVTARSEGGNLVLDFACRITPTGSLKASELLRVLNESFGMTLAIEQADIERLALFRHDADGKSVPLLGEEGAAA